MGGLTTETFAEWWHPSDVIEQYHQLRELNPKALVVSLLSDGLLQAGAGQLVLNGRDHGLSLIPRETWRLAAGTAVWSEGRFRLTHIGDGDIISISAYDVRIDPVQRDLPATETDRSTPPTAPARPAKGGRPSAPWWDDLWIEIARQLYSGDLKPDSQAGIERAMHDWLAARGESVGETTIRTRASRLFRVLCKEDGN